MSHDLFKSVIEQLPTEEIHALLNPDPHLSIAIKSKDQGYLYANHNFLKLMGLSALKDIMHLRDEALCSDAVLLRIYREHDETVYSEDKPLYVQADISPDRQQKLIKSMEGMIYPLHHASNKADAVVLLHKPSNEMISLNLGILLSVSADNLAKHLTKHSYIVQYNDYTISLARMELLCLSELIKGKSASKIAETLGLKSSTVESYLINLRDKCGVDTKRDLVQFFIDSNILESIVL